MITYLGLYINNVGELDRGSKGLLVIGLSSSFRSAYICVCKHTSVCVSTYVYVCMLASFLNRLPHHGNLLEPQVFTFLIFESSRKIFSFPKGFSTEGIELSIIFPWLGWLYLHVVASKMWYSVSYRDYM